MMQAHPIHNLYITSDAVGIPTGGGVVTSNEWDAFREFSISAGTGCQLFGREQLGWNQHGEAKEEIDHPWDWDRWALHEITSRKLIPKLAHFYAGTFTETIAHLKAKGTKISYTCAAHDVALSRQAHERIGLSFPYKHLTEPDLWSRYVKGYLEADLVIVPSKHSEETVRKQGCKNVTIIPHGHEGTKPIKPLPKVYTVGYLGSMGADKNVVTLLQAWKNLAYRDAVLLLGGKDSTSQFIRYLIEHWGGGNICLMGWVKDVSDFYGNISLYCQPSCTEGFGIEILEAMANGRAVIASTRTGACDLLIKEERFDATDVDGLVSMIERAKANSHLAELGRLNQKKSEDYTWTKVKTQYHQAWKQLTT